MCERGHTHLIVFTHVCGYYYFGGAPGAATIQGTASIRVNTVYRTTPETRTPHLIRTLY